ncbi:hypothetical protein H0I76_07680 [Limibaculum sp. M0105]|uniref:Uncharacterized protein n=1 Tax=Thermohalobaculum xanthum TaxID=2753746 RepID=A0A8J7SGI4_9RHOB|nr:hypothetical protein [Thermohalobaculum xanthum]MBK0399065.1 hypothetical protein [Thermohalobaculum xanthum]
MKSGTPSNKPVKSNLTNKHVNGKPAHSIIKIKKVGKGKLDLASHSPPISAINCKSTPQIAMSIDKISLTLPITSAATKGAIWNVVKVQEELGYVKKTYSKNGYSYNAFLSLDVSKEPALLSLYPNKKEYSFVRLEFNPAKMGKDGVEELLLAHMEYILPGGPEQLFQSARVSRLDIAIDLLGIGIKNTLFYSNYAVRSGFYKRNGYLETLYLGSPKSNRQTRIYDKKKEMAKNEIQSESSVPMTRIERVVKHGGPLKELASWEDPFGTLQLCMLSDAPPSIAPWLWRMFCSAANQTTPQATLAQLPPAKKTAFKAAMQQAAPHWWSTEEIWEEWPNTLGAAGLRPSGFKL